MYNMRIHSMIIYSMIMYINSMIIYRAATTNRLNRLSKALVTNLIIDLLCRAIIAPLNMSICLKIA